MILNLLEDATEAVDEIDDGLNNSFKEIMEKLNELVDAFWIYIIIACAVVVVIWGAYIGIKVAIAHKNEDKINAMDMVKHLVIGIIIIFVVAMGAPLIIKGLASWAGVDLSKASYETGSAASSVVSVAAASMRDVASAASNAMRSVSFIKA